MTSVYIESSSSVAPNLLIRLVLLSTHTHCGLHLHLECTTPGCNYQLNRHFNCMPKPWDPPGESVACSQPLKANIISVPSETLCFFNAFCIHPSSMRLNYQNRPSHVRGIQSRVFHYILDTFVVDIFRYRHFQFVLYFRRQKRAPNGIRYQIREPLQY